MSVNPQKKVTNLMAKRREKLFEGERARLMPAGYLPLKQGGNVDKKAYRPVLRLILGGVVKSRENQ